MMQGEEYITDHFVRRSGRDPSIAYLHRTEVQILLNKIRGNDPDTIILKVKNHLRSDINSLVLEEIISALHGNKVCQALYVQNLSKAMKDDQLELLVKLLKKRNTIWCLNLGENYEISKEAWHKFCSDLKDTSVTHLYVSEHTITSKLKNSMRALIRSNRSKHDRHKSFNNLDVIMKCTNMWWNPINAIKHQMQAQLTSGRSSSTSKRRKLAKEDMTPDMATYWQEGVGEGGDKPWKFACKCGELCSSYENARYHPTGRMFECGSCAVWSHVDCVLGQGYSQEDLEELEVSVHSYFVLVY